MEPALDQKGTADNTNPVPGTTLPKGDGGFSAAPPVVLSASGDASSTTRSGISGGTIKITDQAGQEKLTGKTGDETVASVNRDTSNTGGALAPIFDKDKIQAGFDITSQFINQTGTFVANRAAEADAAKKAANDPNLTPDQRAAAQQTSDQINAEWGPGGTYRQVLTALSVAAGGNVTGGMGQLAQNATIAYLQELGTNEVKKIADGLQDETARAALHAIVGCAGAAASNQSCGAGAMGAATSSVLGSLLKPTDGMTTTDREARDSLVTSLVAGVAAVSGQNVATSAGAGKIEVENNQASLTTSGSVPPPPWLAGLIKLPGFKGETAGKGDGVIADPATELDPSIKPGGSLIYPMPDAKTIADKIMATFPDDAKGLVDYVFTAVKDAYQPNQGSVNNIKEFLSSPGFGSELDDAARKTNYQYKGQSVYEVTSKLDGSGLKKGDLFYLDGLRGNHLEVFDGRGNFKFVVNFDGSINQDKTEAASSQG